MAVDTAELRKLDKDTLVEGMQKLAARARRSQEKIKAKAEDAMQVALGATAAFGVGYYMGTVKRDNPGDPEALQIMGLDPDLLIGGSLAAIGLTGMGGKKMSGAALAAGTGVLSLWAGNYGMQMAEQAEG